MIIALIEAQSYHKTHTARSIDCVFALGRVLASQHTRLTRVANENPSGRSCDERLTCDFGAAVGHLEF